MPVASARDVVRAGYARGLSLPPDMTVVEWAEKHRRLGEDSALSGPYRVSTAPYQARPQIVLSATHPANNIVLISGRQVGKTAIALNAIGAWSHLAPRNMVITLPDEDTARKWSVMRLAQLFDSTDVLHGKLKDSPVDGKRKAKADTMYLKNIVGTAAFVTLAWASSGNKLRSTPAKYLISDEVDGWEGDVGGEGDPLTILSYAMNTFRSIGGKHYMTSTPTNQNSRIWREFLKGDQEYFFVPCPHCGWFQVLSAPGHQQLFKRLRWEKGEPETARYECGKCGKHIHESAKSWMLSNGDWLATDKQPDLISAGLADIRDSQWDEIRERMARARSVSFHISSLYAPTAWVPWSEIAAKFEIAAKSSKELRAFVNLDLGEIFEDRGSRPQWELLVARAGKVQPGIAPAGMRMITISVDVQGGENSRLECGVKAWGPQMRSAYLWYEVLRGDVDKWEVWEQLERLMRQNWSTEDGLRIPMWCAAIDSGYLPKMVYQFSRRFAQPHVSQNGGYWANRPQTVIVTKGGHDQFKLIERVSTEDAARQRFGAFLFTIGTVRAKIDIFDALEGVPRVVDGQTVYPHGWMDWPAFEAGFFKSLTSEEKKVKANGATYFEPLREGVRNEVLDIEVGHWAAASIAGADKWGEHDWARFNAMWDGYRVEESRAAVPQAPAVQSQPQPQRTAMQGTASPWMARFLGE